MINGDAAVGRGGPAASGVSRHGCNLQVLSIAVVHDNKPGLVMSLAWGGVRHVMGIERRGFEPSSPPLPLRVIMLASAAKPAAQYSRPILH